jgi:dynein heavy chain
VKADSPPIIDAIESAVDGWCQVIEGVIADSEQIRSEADNVGPHAELQHWKARTASFNSLVDQMKLPRCINAIGVLRAAKSKTEGRWKLVDHRITEESNEAKDNVKYLKTLDHLTEPLCVFGFPALVSFARPLALASVDLSRSLSDLYSW